MPLLVGPQGQCLRALCGAFPLTDPNWKQFRLCLWPSLSSPILFLCILKFPSPQAKIDESYHFFFFYCRGATGCFILPVTGFHTPVNTQRNTTAHKTPFFKAEMLQRPRHVGLWAPIPGQLPSLFPPTACVVKCHFNV